MAKSKKISYLVNLIVAVLVYLVFTYLFSAKIISNYYQGIVILITINAILTVSLNLSTGILGELCLGHAGFMAVGAYASSLLTLALKSSNLPIPLIFISSLLLAGVVAAIAGILVGIPALRLRGDYLAIITLAFGEIIRIIIRSLDFAGGALGLNGIGFYTDFNYSYWTLIILIYFVYAFIRSRQGRCVIAIREDDIAAEASGVNTTKYKTLAFTFSAAFAGIAGGLYAHFQGVITPQQFDYNYSINIMVMVVFGGMGSITGSLLSATILTVLPELLRGMAEYRDIIYALLLILLMLFKPSGLLGKKEFSQAVIMRLFGRNPNKSKGLPVAEEGTQDNFPSSGSSASEADELIKKSLGEAGTVDLENSKIKSKGKR